MLCAIPFLLTNKIFSNSLRSIRILVYSNGKRFTVGFVRCPLCSFSSGLHSGAPQCRKHGWHLHSVCLCNSCTFCHLRTKLGPGNRMQISVYSACISISYMYSCHITDERHGTLTWTNDNFKQLWMQNNDKHNACATAMLISVDTTCAVPSYPRHCYITKKQEGYCWNSCSYEPIFGKYQRQTQRTLQEALEQKKKKEGLQTFTMAASPLLHRRWFSLPDSV